MTSDGFPTKSEIRQLEAEADKLLQQDAKEKGFIQENGRGYTAYAKSIGITTKKILETTYKHEAAIGVLYPSSSFTVEERMDYVSREKTPAQRRFEADRAEILAERRARRQRVKARQIMKDRQEDQALAMDNVVHEEE